MGSEGFLIHALLHHQDVPLGYSQMWAAHVGGLFAWPWQTFSGSLFKFHWAEQNSFWLIQSFAILDEAASEISALQPEGAEEGGDTLEPEFACAPFHKIYGVKEGVQTGVCSPFQVNPKNNKCFDPDLRISR